MRGFLFLATRRLMCRLPERPRWASPSRRGFNPRPGVSPGAITTLPKGRTAKHYATIFANVAIRRVAPLFQMSKIGSKPLRQRHPEAIAKPRAFVRHWGFAEARSQDQRLAQIDRFGRSVVLGSLHGNVIEKVKPQRVFCRVGFRKQTVPQFHPFLLPHLTLEDRLLHASPVIRARSRHPT